MMSLVLLVSLDSKARIQQTALRAPIQQYAISNLRQRTSAPSMGYSAHVIEEGKYIEGRK